MLSHYGNSSSHGWYKVSYIACFEQELYRVHITHQIKFVLVFSQIFGGYQAVLCGAARDPKTRKKGAYDAHFMKKHLFCIVMTPELLNSV